MKHQVRWAGLLVCLACLVALGVGAAPGVAMIGGTQDTANIYPNVGIVLVHYDWGWDFAATCTLVKNENGNVAVLTAGHVTDYLVSEGGPGLTNTRVAFAPLTDWDASAWPRQDLPFTSYQVVAQRTHPVYVESVATTPYLGDSKRFGIGPGREDVALMWLDEPVTGVSAAQIAGLGELDGLTLRDETFTAVGYGLNEFPLGSYMAMRNPQFSWTWSGRNYRDVTLVSVHEAFADRYLKTTVSTNFGDSGGPVFHGDVVVAVTSWGQSMRSVSPAYPYRLDTKSAQDFLTSGLASGPDN